MGGNTLHRPSDRGPLGWLQRIIGAIFPFSPMLEPDDPRTRSWVRRLHAPADVPPAYLPIFDRIPSLTSSPFPYAVLTPTFRGGPGRPEPERLLCLVDGNVHVVEPASGGLDDRIYVPQDVVWTERGLILLYSWITLRSLRDGRVQSTTVRFNSVSEELMLPFVEALRPSPNLSSPADPDVQRRQLDFLVSTNFKFMSYGCKSLRPSDRIRRILFQPELRPNMSGLNLFAFWRPVSPAHLTILTDCELIQIRDEAGTRWSKRAPYGAIWTYTPLAAIQHASADPEGDLITLSIQLSDLSTLRCHFDSQRAEEMSQLCTDLRPLP